MVEAHKILVLIGPSGSGKTTVGNELSKRGIKKLVTTTTREPREGEVDGEDYYFIHEKDLSDTDFLERTIYNSEQYGLTLKEINKALKKHRLVHVALDKNGAEVIRKSYPDKAYLIFFDVSEEEMIQRMKKRGDSHEAITERVRHKRLENEAEKPDHVDLVVINDQLENTVQVILDALNYNESHAK